MSDLIFENNVDMGDFYDGNSGTGYEQIPPVPYDWSNVTNTSVSNSVEVTGGSGGSFFDSLSSGANSLLNFYGKVQSIDAAADAARFNHTIRGAELELQQQRAIGAVDVAKIQTKAGVDIARAQADAAAARTRQEATVAQGGGAIRNVAAQAKDNYALLIGLAGLALAVWQMQKKS